MGDVEIALFIAILIFSIGFITGQVSGKGTTQSKICSHPLATMGQYEQCTSLDHKVFIEKMREKAY
jgi:hypothetical protein